MSAALNRSHLLIPHVLGGGTLIGYKPVFLGELSVFIVARLVHGPATDHRSGRDLPGSVQVG